MIYRYRMAVDDFPEIVMPRDAQVLSVAPDRSGGAGTIDLWAVVDPTAPLEPRKFQIVGTGNPHGPLGRFIGTVPTAGGALIWHVFEAAS